MGDGNALLLAVVRGPGGAAAWALADWAWEHLPPPGAALAVAARSGPTLAAALWLDRADDFHGGQRGGVWVRTELRWGRKKGPDCRRHARLLPVADPAAPTRLAAVLGAAFRRS